MKKNSIFILLFVALVFSACEKVGEYYIGLNQQPKFIENEFEPGLNVFGVLRTDTIMGYPKSFLEATELIEALDTGGIDVTEMDAFIYELENGVLVDTFELELTKFEGVFQFEKFRSPELFAKTGKSYELYCETSNGFVVSSQTTVPDVPQIIGNPEIGNNKISIIIQGNLSCFMYDMFVLSDENFAWKRIFSNNAVNEHVEIDLDFSLKGDEILAIYTYDEKLANYYATSNTFYKPNSYRPRFTTVDGGYGCFGSVNFAFFEI